MTLGIYGQKLKMNGSFWVKERFDRNHGIFTFDEVKEAKCFKESTLFVSYVHDVLHNEKSITINECQLLCHEMDKCKFWRYRLEDNSCFLLNTFHKEDKHTDWISGPKTCPQLGKFKITFKRLHIFADDTICLQNK